MYNYTSVSVCCMPGC